MRDGNVAAFTSVQIGGTSLKAKSSSIPLLFRYHFLRKKKPTQNTNIPEITASEGILAIPSPGIVM